MAGLCHSVSWTSTGRTATPQTQPMQLLAPKPMTIICIIRMYKPSKFYSTLICRSNRFGVCYVLLCLVYVIDFIMQGVADPNEEAYLTNVCSTSVSIVVAPTQKLNNALDLNRIQSDAALGNSPLWFGGKIDCSWILSELISCSSLRRMGPVDSIRGYRRIPLQVGRCSKVLIQQRCWVDCGLTSCFSLTTLMG